MLGMIYSGKIDALDGVITVTSMSYRKEKVNSLIIKKRKKSDLKDVSKKVMNIPFKKKNVLTACINVLNAADLTNAESSWRSSTM